MTTPTLMAPDEQDTWAPTWVLECAAFPHIYAMRDVDVPGVPGTPFTVGGSSVGGSHLIGGRAGRDALQAFGYIIGKPTITRRIVNSWWGLLEVQDVSITLANADGELAGDYRGQPFTLSHYDVESHVKILSWTGIVAATSRDRGVIEIQGTNVDLAILEEQLPKGVVEPVMFPDAPDMGLMATWLMGNAKNVPLVNVKDDTARGEFDYLVCRGQAAAILAARRLTPGSAVPFVEMDLKELEPYPGMEAVVLNGPLEDWTGSSPDFWSLTGAGATVAKTTTAAQVSEGGAAASVTTPGGVTVALVQSLSANTPLPISWWQGREITVTLRARTSVAAVVVLRVSDGVNTFDSIAHTGSGNYETLTVGTISVPCVLDPAATSITVRGRISSASGATTVQFDDVRVYLRPKSWAEVLRTDLYDGYTAIRCFSRQADSSGSLFRLAADVNGLQAERNPVRAIRTLLSDPTHGLGRTVDAPSFDAAETAVAFDYTDLAIVDKPQVLLRFDDEKSSTVAADESGYERHGTYVVREVTSNVDGLSNPLFNGAYDNGDFCLRASVNTQWVEIPYYAGLDPTSNGVSIEVFYWADTWNDATRRPIAEKTIGGVFGSSYGLYQESGGSIKFSVHAGASDYTVSVPLTSNDNARWLHIVGKADGAGAMALHVRMVSGYGAAFPFAEDVAHRVATGTYSGTIASGDGKTYVAKFGGLTTAPQGKFDNFAIYGYALPDARITAHGGGRDLMVSDSGLVAPSQARFSPPYHLAVQYDYPLTSDVSVSTLRHFRLGETSGTAAADAQGLFPFATYVGTPTLGVAGGLNPRRGLSHGDKAVSFENNIAKYVLFPSTFVAGYDTLPYSAFTVACLFKPDYKKHNGGLIEKTIAGVANTQWALYQEGAAIVWALKTSTGLFTTSFPIKNEDVGRYVHITAAYSDAAATIALYRNGRLVASLPYTGTAVTGSGDTYFGKRGTIGGVAAYPCAGDLDEVSLMVGYISAGRAARLYTAASWYPGGLLVDLAMTEARATRDWLEQLCQLRGIRLSFTAAGAVTCTVDAYVPVSTRLAARDGSGDGDRNIVALKERQFPRIDNTTKDLVIKYRRDLLSGAWLGEIRRTVHASIGRDRIIELDSIREHFTADRVADYLAKRTLYGEETVELTMGQEARQLVEGELVMLTDANMGYSGDLLEAREVRRALETVVMVLQGWSELIYTYTPSAFPLGAGPG